MNGRQKTNSCCAILMNSANSNWYDNFTKYIRNMQGRLKPHYFLKVSVSLFQKKSRLFLYFEIYLKLERCFKKIVFLGKLHLRKMHDFCKYFRRKILINSVGLAAPFSVVQCQSTRKYQYTVHNTTEFCLKTFSVMFITLFFISMTLLF